MIIIVIIIVIITLIMIITMIMMGNDISMIMTIIMLIVHVLSDLIICAVTQMYCANSHDLACALPSRNAQMRKRLAYSVRVLVCKCALSITKRCGSKQRDKG
jgi:hypothetical protein